LETLRLHRFVSLHLANVTKAKMPVYVSRPWKNKLNSNIVVSVIHSYYCNNNNGVTVQITAITIYGYTHITLLGTAGLYWNSTMSHPRPPHPQKIPRLEYSGKVWLGLAHCLLFDVFDTFFFSFLKSKIRFIF
jgi:hypothetical protein